MIHTYKAKQYCILKINGIPIEMQQDVIFNSKTNLLDTDIKDSLNIDNIYELIDGEYISLTELIERLKY